MEQHAGMNRCVIGILSCMALVFASCTGEYDFGLAAYKKKVVVISHIRPGRPMVVYLYWNTPEAPTGTFIRPDDVVYEMIEGAQVEIAEEGTVVFSGLTNSEGIAESAAQPTAGKQYTLRVEVDGQPEITASTYIPQPADMKIESVREKQSNWAGCVVMEGGSFVLPDDAAALWIEGSTEYDNGHRGVSYYIYSSSPFPDPVNAVTGSTDPVLCESNVFYHTGFMRIPKASVTPALNLKFSYDVSWEGYQFGESGSPDDYTVFYVEKAGVYLTAASYDYDKFRRGAYKQSGVFRETSLAGDNTVRIYSNIRNGIGIFAGYNVTEVYAPVNNPRRQ